MVTDHKTSKSRGDPMVKDREQLGAIVEALVQALHPVRIILFGSRARGQARPDSDFDLLVVADTTLPPIDRMFAARKALWGQRICADIFVLTPSEYDAFSRQASSVAARANQEGLVLYEAAS